MSQENRIAFFFQRSVTHLCNRISDAESNITVVGDGKTEGGDDKDDDDGDDYHNVDGGGDDDNTATIIMATTMI